MDLERQPEARPSCRLVRPGELIAMHPGTIRSGPEGMFWMLGGGAKPSERLGSVSVVYIRDALEHHDDCWSDNYEAIVQRVSDAMTGADEVARRAVAQQRHEWANAHKPGYKPLPAIEPTPPDTVMLSIDSPGGVVSGLNETVAKLQAMSRDSGIRLVAYADEMAASAAYAIACACSRIYCPASAIIGSVGVVSTMVSVARANEKEGVDAVLITSGDRKADGHPLVPISASAVRAERDRVMKLANAFWELAGKARGLSPKTLASYQAGIFLGEDAQKRGLVDRVTSMADVVAKLSGDRRGPGAGGNETDRRAKMNLTHFGSTWQAARMNRFCRRP